MFGRMPETEEYSKLGEFSMYIFLHLLLVLDTNWVSLACFRERRVSFT